MVDLCSLRTRYTKHRRMRVMIQVCEHRKSSNHSENTRIHFVGDGGSLLGACDRRDIQIALLPEPAMIFD